jgi:hypothetical protein
MYVCMCVCVHVGFKGLYMCMYVVFVYVCVLKRRDFEPINEMLAKDLDACMHVCAGVRHQSQAGASCR